MGASDGKRHTEIVTPFILRQARIIVNDRAKIHCNPGTVTKEDHTI